MSTQKTKNQVGYDQWASFYDQYANPTIAIDELAFPDIYSEIKNKNVLEVGCGTGRHTRRLLAMGNKVTGIDVSEGMLQRLREKIHDKDLILLNGDFTNTDISGGPFDAIIESLVLEHVPDLTVFFRKSRGLLKPGGQLFLSEIHPERTSSGVFAHFRTQDGSEFHLDSSAHKEVDIERAAHLEGFIVKNKITVCGDGRLTSQHQKWSRYEGTPMIQIWVMEVSP